MRALPPEMQENEDIRRAAELCEEGAFTPAELAAYDKYWDMISVEKTMIESAHNQGLAEGLAKGQAEALAKGRTERDMEIARNMLKKGLSVDDISDITGLSKLQIEELKE